MFLANTMGNQTFWYKMCHPFAFQNSNHVYVKGLNDLVLCEGSYRGNDSDNVLTGDLTGDLMSDWKTTTLKSPARVFNWYSQFKYIFATFIDSVPQRTWSLVFLQAKLQTSDYTLSSFISIPNSSKIHFMYLTLPYLSISIITSLLDRTPISKNFLKKK